MNMFLTSPHVFPLITLEHIPHANAPATAHAAVTDGISRPKTPMHMSTPTMTSTAETE